MQRSIRRRAALLAAALIGAAPGLGGCVSTVAGVPRVGTDRANPYQHVGSLRSVGTGLPVYSTSTCANSAPAINPEAPESETISKAIIEQILAFKIVNKPETPNEVAAPACIPQEPFTFNGQTSQFPHVVYSEK